MIHFQECAVPGYKARTIMNATADVTIAIAIDFDTAGERLTKKAVLDFKKLYIPINGNNLSVTSHRIEEIAKRINDRKFTNSFSLNIAGNGLYKMSKLYTQEQCDDFLITLITALVKFEMLNCPISSITTGGQTGFDEAGAKAGDKLGIKTRILAPNGWVFRDINGKDIADEALFKARFN